MGQLDTLSPALQTAQDQILDARGDSTEAPAGIEEAKPKKAAAKKPAAKKAAKK